MNQSTRSCISTPVAERVIQFINFVQARGYFVSSGTLRVDQLDDGIDPDTCPLFDDFTHSASPTFVALFKGATGTEPTRQDLRVLRNDDLIEAVDELRWEERAKSAPKAVSA